MATLTTATVTTTCWHQVGQQAARWQAGERPFANRQLAEKKSYCHSRRSSWLQTGPLGGERPNNKRVN